MKKLFAFIFGALVAIYLSATVVLNTQTVEASVKSEESVNNNRYDEISNGVLFGGIGGGQYNGSYSFLYPIPSPYSKK